MLASRKNAKWALGYAGAALLLYGLYAAYGGLGLSGHGAFALAVFWVAQFVLWVMASANIVVHRARAAEARSLLHRFMSSVASEDELGKVMKAPRSAEAKAIAKKYIGMLYS